MPKYVYGLDISLVVYDHDLGKVKTPILQRIFAEVLISAYKVLNPWGRPLLSLMHGLCDARPTFIACQPHSIIAFNNLYLPNKWQT